MPISALAAARAVAIGVVSVFAGMQAATAASLLNSAQDYAVLGATTVTGAGPGSQVFGDLGVSPGSAVTGFPPSAVVVGTIHNADAQTGLAQADATAAYNALGALDPLLGVDLTGKSLGSLGSPGLASLSPGVYSFATTASVNGMLTLDFATNPTGSFVFLIGSALLTGTDAAVSVLNGGAFSSIYWRVVSSATLGSGTSFAGNILANTSISMDPGAQILGGRALALNGAVTMIGGGVSSNCSFGGCVTPGSDFGSQGFSGLSVSPVPEPASALLLATGGLALCLIRSRGRKNKVPLTHRSSESD